MILDFEAVTAEKNKYKVALSPHDGVADAKNISSGTSWYFGFLWLCKFCIGIFK